MKKNITAIFIVLWIAFSAGYIAYDQWQGFRTGQVSNAYQQGMADSVRLLMQESAKCSPVPLYDGEEEMQVISVECLQKAQEEQQRQQQLENDKIKAQQELLGGLDEE